MITRYSKSIFLVLFGFLFGHFAITAAIDWNDPTNSTTYTDVLGDVRERDENIAKMDFASDTNIPTGFIRYNDTDDQLEEYNGSTWDDIVARALDDDTIHGFFGITTPATNDVLQYNGSAYVGKDIDELLANGTLASLSDVTSWATSGTSSGCSGGGCSWSESPTSFRYIQLEDMLCFYYDGGDGNAPTAATAYLSLTLPQDFVSQAGSVSRTFFALLQIDSTYSIATAYLADNTNDLLIYSDTSFGSFANTDNINFINVGGCYETA